MKQNLTANTIYELLFGKGKAFLNQGGISDAILGGWKFSAIAGLRSGPWLTLGSSQSLGVFVNAQTTVVWPSQQQIAQWRLGQERQVRTLFQHSECHKDHHSRRPGELRRWLTFPGPGSATWDLSGNKTWTFAERYGLTFRADAFNAFNRVNFAGLSTNATSSTFGKVTSASPARTIQLSMRMSF